MPKTTARQTVWDLPSTRSAGRRIRDWERNITLFASIPGAHQTAWIDAMVSSVVKLDRERVEC